MVRSRSTFFYIPTDSYARAEDAFVKYLCHTKDGKSFRNVEYLRIKNGKLQSIECYFGAQSSFPSAVSTGQK
jgi:hypothetical protein